MKNILIICTANKTRSPLAMEIANHIAMVKNAPYSFKSAGVAVVGKEIDDNVVKVLREIGIETTHTPKYISEYNLNDFDAIHVMTQRQKITVASLSNKSIEKKITVLGVSDPYYNGIEAYRKCRDELIGFYDMYIK